MLLPTDADGFDLAGAGFGLAQRLANGAGRRITPCVGMLFLRAWGQAGQQIVRLRGRGDDFAVPRIHHYNLGGLRSAIDADE